MDGRRYTTYERKIENENAKLRAALEKIVTKGFSFESRATTWKIRAGEMIVIARDALTPNVQIEGQAASGLSRSNAG